MERPIIYLCAIGLLASCGQGGQGQLIGVQARPGWYQVDPYGMNYIGMGSFIMGPSDQDVPYAMVTKSKTVSVQAFYIDQTEISNNEYRQFVEYVRDSIAKRILGDEDIGEHVLTEDEFGEEIDPPKINWPMSCCTTKARRRRCWLWKPTIILKMDSGSIWLLT